MLHNHEVLDDLKQPTKALRHAIPETWAGFLALHGAAVAEGEVPTRIKEAVALTLSVVKRCDGCIAYHAKAAARAGATPAEVAELLGVALLMDGGTASVYAPRAFDAFLEFQAESAPGRGVVMADSSRGSTHWARPTPPRSGARAPTWVSSRPPGCRCRPGSSSPPPGSGRPWTRAVSATSSGPCSTTPGRRSTTRSRSAGPRSACAAWFARRGSRLRWPRP